MAGVSAADEGDDVPSDVPVDGPATVAENRLLASLARQARAVNLARVVRLVELLDASDAGGLDEAGRSEAENLAHQVVGSAGTFGFPSASVDAVAIEEYFATGPAGSAGPAGSGAGTGTVRRTLEGLRAQFGGGAGGPAQR
ncbi:MAG: hypothetical protein ACRYG2_35075 [Janthinobacterium lividum]